MATVTMATAAGAAALLYYTLNHKLKDAEEEVRDEGGNGRNTSRPSSSGRNQVSRRPVQAPATWLETISTLSETLRFTYSETLAKWPIGDLAFGINFLLKRQGNLHVASIYAGKESVQLKGAEITAELRYLLNLLTLCWHFSKKPFPLFLEATGYSEEDVLLQEPKAGILKPSFTIIVDKNAKCILLLIRGTHSIRDTLTAATGAIVPFHHTVVHEGGVSNLVLGYAHCGMVAAARWIAKLATPCLTKALHDYPDCRLKIVGHSLGGGTAALLTYVLREQQEFSTATCVTFAPAACMTWELAESGVNFITSVINGADLVPTFSAASVDDLRSEVTGSAWLNDLRNQIEQTRILSTVYRSASALGSRLPSIANAKARVAGAGAILRPVSSGTQVVMKRAKNAAQAAWTRQPLRLSSWSCIGPRHRNQVSTANSNSSAIIAESTSTVTSSEIVSTSNDTSTSITSGSAAETITTVITSEGGVGWTTEVECCGSNERNNFADMDEDDDMGEAEDLIGQGGSDDSMTEVELWQQLENELYRPPVTEEEVEIAKEIKEEEDAMAVESNDQATASSSSSSDSLLGGPATTEARRFYPAGKIMHIVTLLPSDDDAAYQEDSDSGSEGSDGNNAGPPPRIGIFSTPRSLYGKLRLSKLMINDHYMPIYRRNIEQLISELEKDTSTDVCPPNQVVL